MFIPCASMWARDSAAMFGAGTTSAGSMQNQHSQQAEQTAWRFSAPRALYRSVCV